MALSAPAFPVLDMTIGRTADGRALVLAPMTPGVAATLGPQIAALGPWAHYGYDAAFMERVLAAPGPGSIAYQVRCADELAGAVVIVPSWLAGPYLRILALTPGFQRLGAGAAVLAWFEARAAGQRQVWLCVSGVNARAHRLYARHGYEVMATLSDLLRDGDDEVLMRKRLARTG